MRRADLSGGKAIIGKVAAVAHLIGEGYVWCFIFGVAQ